MAIGLISSFDDYFTRANQLGQRLLIEIKTSKKDSKNMMELILMRHTNQGLSTPDSVFGLPSHRSGCQHDFSIPSFLSWLIMAIFPMN